MSETKYPRAPQSANKKKTKKTEADKYQKIVKSHPIESTYNTRQEKKKKKLIKEESQPSINDSKVKEIAKKAVKKW